MCFLNDSFSGEETELEKGKRIYSRRPTRSVVGQIRTSEFMFPACR